MKNLGEIIGNCITGLQFDERGRWPDHTSGCVVSMERLGDTWHARIYLCGAKDLATGTVEVKGCHMQPLAHEALRIAQSLVLVHRYTVRAARMLEDEQHDPSDYEEIWAEEKK